MGFLAEALHGPGARRVVPRHLSEGRQTLPAGRGGFHPADHGIRREREEGEGRTLIGGDGWDAGIRTPIRSSRGCSLTVRRRPSKSETPFYQTRPRESTMPE